jgi:hypothetical protein
MPRGRGDASFTIVSFDFSSFKNALLENDLGISNILTIFEHNLILFY